MIRTFFYSLTMLGNLALIPFYWNLHENIRIINTFLDVLSEFGLNLNIDKVQNYLVVMIVFAILFVLLWIMFCISRNHKVQWVYLFILLVLSIMGIVMVNELEYTLEFFFDGKVNECVELMQILNIEYSLTRYSYCQESWVYKLYYAGYGLMVLLCVVFVATLIDRHEEERLVDRRPTDSAQSEAFKESLEHTLQEVETH